MPYERLEIRQVPEGHLFDPTSPGDWYRITEHEPIPGMSGGIMSFWERDPESVISISLPVRTSDIEQGFRVGDNSTQ